MVNLNLLLLTKSHKKRESEFTLNEMLLERNKPVVDGSRCRVRQGLRLEAWAAGRDAEVHAAGVNLRDSKSGMRWRDQRSSLI
jgi:hypothetical protein